MLNDKPVKRVIDIKNSQSYVEYEDGSFGFHLTQWLTQEQIKAYEEEKRSLSTLGD